VGFDNSCLWETIFYFYEKIIKVKKRKKGIIMKKKNYVILVTISFITLFCSSLAFGEGMEIKLDKAEWKKMNIFFSNFSEVFVKPFEKGKINNSPLIEFGIFHNKFNNDKLFIPYGSSHLKLDKKYVEASVEKYFGIKLINHETIEDATYKDGFYIIPESAGEVYIFSQVTKFVDIGNGYYVAYLNIYTASSGFAGDPNGNLNSWKKEDDVPELTEKMKATVQKITSNCNSRYILIEYLEDK
jgi:hypothetical protein